GESKPKLNLVISFEGNQITVKVKPTMKFGKIFHAAEQRWNKDSGTLRFTYDGQRIDLEETPATLGMEDGDQIDAHLMQVS
ncbi:hypothetical protein M378DRAFT_31624, partial [Amanita muscaria Koide BX008]